MLKLQGKKQTNLTPTLRDDSDNHEIKNKKKKKEIAGGLIEKKSYCAATWYYIASCNRD